ncbi:MAG: hypothetical protein ACLTMP_06695 [Eggerthella lenta]
MRLITPRSPWRRSRPWWRAGRPTFDEVDGEPRLTGGVVVRHPCCRARSRTRSGSCASCTSARRRGAAVADEPVHARAGGRRKAGDTRAAATLDRCPELAERVSDDEYELLLDYADELGVEDYFWQQGGAAEDSFIPAFDLSGVREPDRA